MLAQVLDCLLELAGFRLAQQDVQCQRHNNTSEQDEELGGGGESAVSRQRDVGPVFAAQPRDEQGKARTRRGRVEGWPCEEKVQKVADQQLVEELGSGGEEGDQR